MTILILGQPPDLTRLGPGCAYEPRCSFRVKRCAEDLPPLQNTGSKHISACWQYRELDQITRSRA